MLFTFFVATVLNIDFPNMKTDLAEVIGASSSAYALRVTAHIYGRDDDKKSLCAYPSTPKVKAVDGVDLVLCVVGKECGPRLPVYALPREPEPSGAIVTARCTTPELARTQLTEAKRQISDAGLVIDESVSQPATRIKSNIATFAAGTLAAFGLTEPIELVLAPSTSLPPEYILTVRTEHVPAQWGRYPWASGVAISQAMVVPKAGVMLLFLDMPMIHETHFSPDANSAFDGAPLELPLNEVAAMLLYQRGLKAHREKRFLEAAEAFEKAMQAQPSLDANLQLARSRSRLHEKEAAFNALQKALELDFTRASHEVRTEHDFDLWRKDPGFEQLLEAK